MKKKKLLIITGLTGFIGTSLLNNKLFLENFEIIGINTTDYLLFDKKIKKIAESEFYKKIKKYKTVDVLHLAQLYDLDENNKIKIWESNYNFGVNFFRNLIENNIKISSILFTNTVFSLSGNQDLKNSSYVLSKNKFSSFLDTFSKENVINYIEVYLSNTLGIDDTRNNIIPNIIKSIFNKDSFEIRNSESYLNILDVDLILNQFYKLFSINSSRKITIISKYEFLISSIYNFLNNYINNGKEVEIKKQLSVDTISDTDFKKIDFNLSETLKKIVDDLI